jgi:hypothetical protein
LTQTLVGPFVTVFAIDVFEGYSEQTGGEER